MTKNNEFESEKAAFGIGVLVGVTVTSQLVRYVYKKNRQLAELCYIQAGLIETWEEVGVELHTTEPPRKELMDKIRERYEFAKLAIQTL